MVVIVLLLTCVITAAEAYGYWKYCQYYGLNKYYALRYGKIGGGSGTGYKAGNKLRVYYDNKDQDPTYYYPGKNVGYPHGIYGRSYRLNKHKYGQYGLKNRLRHRNYSRNYLRHGYKKTHLPITQTIMVICNTVNTVTDLAIIGTGNIVEGTDLVDMAKETDYDTADLPKSM